jgi:hypothetical protein
MARWQRAAAIRGRMPLIASILALEIALTILLVRAPVESALAAVSLIAGAAVVAAALFALPEGERQPLLVLFLAGLMIRIVVMLIAHYHSISPVNPHGFLYRDSIGYDRVGWNLAEHWRAGRPPRLEYQTASFSIGFHYAVALVYIVAGHAPLLVKSLNVLVSASLIPLTFLLGRGLAGARAGLIAALLMTLSPPIIFWSVQILKDVLITFLLLTSALAWLAFVRRPRVTHLLAAVLPAALLVPLRAYMFFFWTIGVAFGLILWAAYCRRWFVALILAVAVAGSGIWAAIEYSALGFWNLDLMIATLSAIGGVPSSIFGQVEYRSLGDILAFYPLGFIRFLLTPLPWRVELLNLPDAFGSLIRYALLPFATIGLVHLWRRQRIAIFPIVVCGFLAISLYAVAFRGGGIRHMTQLYPYFFLLAAVGLPRFPHWPLPLALGFGGFLVAALATSPG